MAMAKCKECKKDISGKANICPHCGIKNPNVTGGVRIVSAIIVIIIIIFLLSECFSDPETQPQPQTQTADLIPFKIIEKKNQSFAETSRMTYRVLLNIEEPSNQNVKDVALVIWNDGNKSWKEFTIFFYLPEMHTDSFAYGIANFTPDGLKNLDIKTIKEKTKTALTSSPDLEEYFYCGYTNIDGSNQDYSKWGKGTDFKYNASKNRWELINEYTSQYIYPDGKYEQITKVSYFDNRKGLCNSEMEKIYKKETEIIEKYF